MLRIRRPDESPDEMPQTLWQFLGYALRLVVEKVLGDWARTLQLWLLGVLPILVVFGAAALVVGAVHPSPQGWGVVAGTIFSVAAGVSLSRGVARRVRTRRSRRLSGAATPPSGDEKPTKGGQ
ncbi:hypothetical protein [Paractinoplanes globisporus]|uniref:Uncharacterized protein n=1 Tax=Paractinoplanes globisporus TaxID=113565 RepID=A0ABW6WWD3_9ACTN|nr:hypothetical protein [Actinoplanes globisporus]